MLSGGATNLWLDTTWGLEPIIYSTQAKGWRINLLTCLKLLTKCYKYTLSCAGIELTTLVIITDCICRYINRSTITVTNLKKLKKDNWKKSWEMNGLVKWIRGPSIERFSYVQGCEAPRSSVVNGLKSYILPISWHLIIIRKKNIFLKSEFLIFSLYSTEVNTFFCSAMFSLLPKHISNSNVHWAYVFSQPIRNQLLFHDGLVKPSVLQKMLILCGFWSHHFLSTNLHIL